MMRPSWARPTRRRFEKEKKIINDKEGKLRGEKRGEKEKEGEREREREVRTAPAAIGAG